MALVKVILGLGAVVLFMPTDKETQAKVYETSAHAVDRVVTFCARNPETCRKGGEYWAVFKQKAEFGAHMAWTLAVEHMNKPNGKADPDTASPSTIPVNHQAPAKRGEIGATIERGTLKPRDLEPVWRPAATPVRQGA